MEPVNETGLTNRIVKAIRQNYPSAWIFKVHGGPMQMSGVPDLLLSVEGLLIGAEVKFPRPGESQDYTRSRATPNQRAKIRDINASGGFARVVISVDETLKLIEDALREHGKDV